MAERNYLTARTQEAASERSAAEIRQDIATKRESITETVDRLSDRFQQTFDWRTYVADYPYLALGVAAGLGLLLSGVFKPRPTPRERIMDALAESVEDLSSRFRDHLDLWPAKKMGAGRTVKAAATAMVTKAAADYLKNRVGGAFQPPAESTDHARSRSSGSSGGRNADVESDI